LQAKSGRSFSFASPHFCFFLQLDEVEVFIPPWVVISRLVVLPVVAVETQPSRFSRLITVFGRSRTTTQQTQEFLKFAAKLHEARPFSLSSS
jgi:hypothetical protein